jgi:hypothetical protein
LSSLCQAACKNIDQHLQNRPRQKLFIAGIITGNLNK